MPYLSKIIVYPIKSLDGVDVSSSKLTDEGALVHDREFALFDERDQYVNGKSTARIHQIRASYDLTMRTISVGIQGQPERDTFHLDRDRSALETWFTQYFGYSIFIRQNIKAGFPDDTNASGPTIVSQATLETVASWFPGISLDDVRQRFRPNLEVEDAPAFWEDQLFATDGQPVPFQIGNVELRGINPCQRCIVPTRHPRLGDRTPNFQQDFSSKRRATLPAWAPSERFNHFYKLTTNTWIAPTEAAKMLQVGDEIVLA